MTDEELAEKYVDEYGFGSDCNNLTSYDANQSIEQAYLEGLKAGKPQWHDLKKDPNDLPNNDRVVSDQEGTNVRYVKFRDKWFYLDRTAEANIIAWCEIPKFEEE